VHTILMSGVNGIHFVFYLQNTHMKNKIGAVTIIALMVITGMFACGPQTSGNSVQEGNQAPPMESMGIDTPTVPAQVDTLSYRADNTVHDMPGR